MSTNRLKYLEETRGAKIKDLKALQAATESRQMTDTERTDFATITKSIEAIDSDRDLEKRAINLAADKPVSQAGALGLSEKEVRSFNLARAISAIVTNKPLDGLEGEVCAAEARRVGRDTQGLFIPFEVLSSNREQRANAIVGVASDGGYTVASQLDGNLVGLLRNQTHCLALGARVLTGLQGDITIPIHTAGTTAYWVSETGDLTSTKNTFGQLSSKPKRIGVTTNYGKQFLAQSSIGVDSFIREDILAKLGIEIDRTVINGAGGAEPLGILGLPSGDRSTSVTFGAAPTWAKVVSFETLVETANALGLPGGDYAFLTSPAVRGAWKTTAKISGQAQWLWENGNIVNGYAARSTNQMPSNKVIFGQFGQVMINEWLGTEITVDPYTLATTGLVKVTVQKLMDIIVRQPKAFCVSTDAGNQ